MFYKSITYTLALTSVAFGLPQGNSKASTGSAPRVPAIQWDMSTIWSWGSPGGSGSGFDISAPANYFVGAPAFNASCWRNNGEPDDWTACRPRENHDAAGVVVFRRLPQKRAPEYSDFEDMWVSHQYMYGELHVNITGHNVVDWSKDMKGSKKMAVVSKQVN